MTTEMLEFNTGRAYTIDGQIIRAVRLDNGNVVFTDLSRGIFATLEDCPLTRWEIMKRYDAGAYRSCGGAEEYSAVRAMEAIPCTTTR
jgi:hypothetical protein